ncbi:MAG: hypothetical protein CMD39_02160 [Gammaproteobacteria bacterium]|nr:hypothetical protein [Gammaproteobacteria bacterium]
MREAPTRLRCEYRDDPLNVDTARPRLSWWLNDPRPAELQTAYQIQAASSATALQAGSADLWDTGHVSSSRTVNVDYQGRPLAVGDRVWWRVRCYDSDGTPSPWSEAARFELGLAESDWRARWVAAPLEGSPVAAVPAPLLFCDFELPAAPRSARLHVAVLGAVRLSLNGRAVTAEAIGTDRDLGCAPYRSYDVTDLLRSGPNRIAALLGDGAWCGHAAGGPRQRGGRRPMLCAELVVDAGSSPPFRLLTGDGWQWRPGWVLQADRDGGDIVDGRQFLSGWDEPGGCSGYPVDLPESGLVRRADPTPEPRVIACHTAPPPAQRRRSPEGRTRLRYDFGRSITGRLRATVRLAPGATLAVRYGLVEPVGDGAVSWSDAEDRYTGRGGEPERFEPGFALHAFRVVELVAEGEPFDVVQLEAVEVGCGAAATASLRCDHRLLEDGFRAAVRTLDQGLLLGPVRGPSGPDRRLQPVDAPAILAGAAAAVDAAAPFGFWAETLSGAGGAVPAASGDAAAGDTALDGWLPCLWLLYRCYDDRRLLDRMYPAVQGHLDRCADRWTGAAAALEVAVPDQLLGTARYAFALSVAARMAGVLGRLADLEAHLASLDRVRGAFRRRFVTAEGLLAGDAQLGYVLALETGLLEGDEVSVALGRIEAQLRRDGFHPALDLRDLGLLLEVLTLSGRVDLAYQALLQTTSPSWMHAVTAGADLLWDAAGGVPGRLAAAGMAGWLQRFLLGIELDDDLTPERNAYRRVRVQPRPPLGRAFPAGAPVRDIAGHLDTVHGRFEVAWRITAEAFELDVLVPGNAGARVVLPDGSDRLVPAGRHHFAVPLSGLSPAVAPAADIPVLREVSGGR